VTTDARYVSGMSAWDRAEPNQPRGTTPQEPASWSWRSAGAAKNRDVSPTQASPTGQAGRIQTSTSTEAAASASSDGQPRNGSRPVPKMPRARRETQVRSPALTLAGTLLIVGLTFLAFAGGRLFGRVEQPTPVVATVISAPPAVVDEPIPTPEIAAAAVPPAEVTPIPLPSYFARAPIVCLDPGHGGSDRGFSRFFDDGTPYMEEAPLVLQQAFDLKARLEHRGYQVILTRETDAAVNVDGRDVNGDGRTAAHDPPRSDRNKNLDEIQARIDICNAANADLLVSMHLNGFSNDTPRGPEAWFTRERQFGDENAAFATLAYEHLKEQLT
jgi:N-acetylmuramoyl-L-alanine amidase